MAYEEARNLLSDGNNDRATWVAAGRALRHAQNLSAEVTVDAHRRLLELHRLKNRAFFGGILGAKPAAFFYGASDPSIPINQAAAESTAPGERAGRPLTSTVKALAEASLLAVWEAAQWPTDYEDPLANRKFPEDVEGLLMVLTPGLHEYLEHAKGHLSVSGKVWPQKRE